VTPSVLGLDIMTAPSRQELPHLAARLITARKQNLWSISPT